MNPLCIFHGGCDDGFASAYIVNKALNGAVDFHYGIYQKDPPDVVDRDVILVDFSYKRNVIDRIGAEANTLLILDHHHTAQQDLAGFPPPLDGGYNPLAMTDWQRECNAPAAVHSIFDMERSGAGITWDYFNPNKPMPWLFEYIQDRDLWKKELPNSDQIIMALRSYPQNFDIWTKIIKGGPDALLAEGKAIHRYYRTIIDGLKKNATRQTIAGINVPVVNCPFYFASEVAGELAEGEPFAACYWIHAYGVTYSLRSRNDGMNVGEIAENYGGGGHRGAAGFKIESILD